LTIQVELNYSALRRPWIDLPVPLFVAEAFNRSPEITSIACVSVAETAAEKLVSLTGRTAMELAGVARVRDPTLVRHIYDLHVTSAYYDATEVAQLAREIMPRDAEEFGIRYPTYRENPVEEMRRALAALETEHHFAQRCTEFLQLMVYGVKPAFDEAMATIDSLVGRL
jgi:Nucleotidyl transferase AbiEii toxin, Type IV TA system